MCDSHNHFETLGALAASDSLAQAGLSDLRRQADHCATCKEQLLQIERVNKELFLACALSEPSRGTPKGMRDRFVERANMEGIGLRPRAARVTPVYAPMLASFAVLVLTVMVTSNWRSSVSSRTLHAGSSQALLSTDSGRSDLIASQNRQGSRGVHRASATRVHSQMDETHSGHGDRTVGEAMRVYAKKHASEIHSESTAPRIDFVMYSPQPKFSRESIPSLSMTWEGHGLQSSLARDSVEFEHAFSLTVAKPLLEASSDLPQPLTQPAYIPNGIMNFRFNPSDFHELQVTTH
jgi:hypothetical protein